MILRVTDLITNQTVECSVSLLAETVLPWFDDAPRKVAPDIDWAVYQLQRSLVTGEPAGLWAAYLALKVEEVKE